MESAAPRRLLVGCLLIVGVVFLCIGGLVLAVDRLCVSALAWRLPIYPDAQIVTERYSFLTPGGMGQTIRVLYAPADYLEVQRWYGVTVGQRLREASSDGTALTYFNLTLGSQWSVTRAEDGVGAQIILLGTCASARFE